MVSDNDLANVRPLRGEPLALDLVNTEWVDAGVRRDLLENPAGTAVWLSEGDFEAPSSGLEDIRRHLIETRETLRLLLENQDEEQGRARLNAILDQGRVIAALGPSGPESAYDIAAGWEPAWHAAFNYLELLRDWPEARIKACAHPDCILYFLDTSKNGTRRWCDMRTCGNRAKVQRHYRRRKNG
ncbi:CGNR zinc finger domain-containing protein [Ferruginivarius sediminum]|uniref:Zf-CGNR multi-domain protein n=1 Tax=Ferruginivarius sediminum TaxID=2661937 RepID=A0A369T980_9PROT|nr:CGNR zinc finger domain-containing protein [Ferruginivarius sediminum]RDD60727.1 zf-CGNR multi-domain protein [Ferruginivarius sediminum]